MEVSERFSKYCSICELVILYFQAFHLCFNPFMNGYGLNFHEGFFFPVTHDVIFIALQRIFELQQFILLEKAVIKCYVTTH